MKEPLVAKYLYISEDNIVHVLMPVISGTTIGLDNTCKAVYSLQEFFDKGSHSNQKATLKSELLAYKEALKNDLSLLGEGNALVLQQKQERLTQISAYLGVITQLEKHHGLDCLNKGFPYYPWPLQKLMRNRTTSNLYSIVLRPSVEDGFLRSEAANPIFSVAHRSARKNRDTTVSKLQQALMQAYRPLSYETKDLKAKVIHQVLMQLRPLQTPVYFKPLRKILKQTVEALLNVSVDFKKTKQGEPINQQDIDRFMRFDPKTTTHQEYIETLLGYCAPDLFDTVVESPFNTLIQAESWSIATQFLLGITNFYCIAQGKISPNTNFGQILDSKPVLSKNLAATLALAQQNNHNIEDACLSWMNVHISKLQLKTALTQSNREAIKETFAEYYAEIKDSPHFDEFFLLDTHKKGDFFIHQGHICTLFAKFISSPSFQLPKKLTKPLEKVRSAASALSTAIPHKNQLVQGEIEINTITMNNTALQALYEQINACQDLNLKQQLLVQLKQERPDFKPKVKQFLQHVAYGEQNEAADLLKQDPQLAQELLRAHNIPFTDYSDRTFTCTAYEYAYWAKDAHMLKMLEKYIKNDEETRQFIFRRVNVIEEPVRQSASSRFTRFFTSSHHKPKGLHYTTQDREGQIIEHWEAHFDLTPLKKALWTYIKAYDQSPKRSKADWEALDQHWIKVGLPQREVPAHIAQEYCHPWRSFYNISQNTALLDASNPANLERSLKFYNGVTGADDYWFTPKAPYVYSGLGSSFAILRGMLWWSRGAKAGAHRCRVDAAMYCDDLSAIKAIDRVRTEDLKASLDNLSHPAIDQKPPSHSVLCQ